MQQRGGSAGREASGAGLQFAASLASLFAPLNSTMIAVALPIIRDDFHVGTGAVTWLVSAYLIAVAVGQPAAGRIGDAFGHLRTIQAGLVVLLVFSVLSGLAWSFPVLVATRCLQGVSAALIMPNVIAYLRKLVESEELGRVLGINGAAVSTGAAFGPVIGGGLVALGDWRLIFFANVPIALVSFALLTRLPVDPGRGRSSLVLDLPSLGSLALAFTGVALLGTTLKTGNVALTAVCVAVLPVGAAVYWLYYHGRGSGVVDLHLFTRRNYAAPAAATALSNLVMYTVLIAMPVYLSDLEHMSDLAIGFALFVSSAALIVFSPLSGWLYDRAGSRFLMIGGSLFLLLSAAGLAVALGRWPVAMVILLLAPIGVGTGLMTPAMQTVALQAWPRSIAGSASGTYSMMRYVGSVSGAALIATELGKHPTGADFRQLFLWVGLVAVANVVVANMVDHRRTGAQAAQETPDGDGRALEASPGGG